MSHRAADAGPSSFNMSGHDVRDNHDGLAEAFSDEEAESGSADSDSEGANDNETTEREYHNAIPQPTRLDIKGKAPQSVPSSGHLRTPKAKESGSWADLDLSIIVALVSPIGNWLTGGDHIKNLFLIILLIFYLHQIIEIPWQLYLGARPRKSGRRVSVAQDPEDERITQLTALAEDELRWYEIGYLGVAILSPFVGALFLRHVLFALGERDTLSWFSITLFVLATGIRPWSHLISRLKDRTRELHTVLHYPDEDSLVHLYEQTDETLHGALKRVDALERELRQVRESVKRLERLREVCDDLTEILGDVERAAKRSERKADAARATHNVRIAALERHVEEQRRQDATSPRYAPPATLFSTVFSNGHLGTPVRALVDTLRSLPRKLFQLGLRNPNADERMELRIHLPNNGFTNGNGTLHQHIRSPDREKHLNLVPRLATIPEAEDSDSEETFVGDKDGLVASGAGSPPKGMRSRSGSSGSTRFRKASTMSQVTFEYVEDLFLWPYRFSVRVIVAVLPPMQKIMPKV